MAKLAEAILDRRARSPNYFEGRLLTAEDLTADREAHFARQRILGRAIGAGVVHGLWIEQDATAPAGTSRVTISKGEALSPYGDVLTLQNDLTLTLSAVAEDAADAPDASLFKECAPPETEAVPTGDGFYVLTIAPRSRFEEAAPMRSLTEDSACAGCGKRWAVPGVAFRLVPFDPLNVPGQDPATADSLAELLTGTPGTAALSRLRNIVAHLCFGSDELADFVTDPFAIEASAPRLEAYGTVDYLRSLGVLDGCELPLAVVYWTGRGIEFVDCWSVRRGPVAAALSDTWPSLSTLRLNRENHARLLQFQDQFTRVIAEAAFPSTVVARNYFRYLPAAGLLPIATAARIGPTGEAFFSAQPKREPVEYINGEQLRAAFDRSWSLDPIDLDGAEMVWLYRPWQQDPARSTGRTDRAYLLFTSPHMPPLNVPRFDVARWDFANFPSFDL
jgi:hypothetical protein